MGLIDSKCDSCGEARSVLVLLAVLDELPSGGERLVIKYYCKDCADAMIDDAEDVDDSDDDESTKDQDEDEGLRENVKSKK